MTLNGYCTLCLTVSVHIRNPEVAIYLHGGSRHFYAAQLKGNGHNDNDMLTASQKGRACGMSTFGASKDQYWCKYIELNL